MKYNKLLKSMKYALIILLISIFSIVMAFITHYREFMQLGIIALFIYILITYDYYSTLKKTKSVKFIPKNLTE